MKPLATALGPGDVDDGDEGRRMRGLAIVALDPEHIRPDKLGYKVPSQSGNGSYLVNLDDGPYCTCPDFETTGVACKHVYAVETLLQRNALMDVEPTAVPRIAQPWQSYTASQVHEAEFFETLLWDLVADVPQLPQKGGRPRLPLPDMLYAMAMKVYSQFSTRRAMSGVREAVAEGRVGKEHCYSTTARYFERKELTAVLRGLVERSALPLRDIETTFAIDSTGFATTAYNRWFEHKWGHVQGRKAVKWAKLHAMCGTRTNIITAADATASMSADANYLPEFVRITAQHFHIDEVSGDKAYSSRKNLVAVDDAGGTPYIPFSRNAKSGGLSMGKTERLWRKMYLLFTLNEAEFNRHYHRRSNIETCFYMMKTKFGDKLKSKTDTAMVNEALTMVLCHNICCIIRAMYTLGITPDFEPEFGTGDDAG